MQLSNKVYNVLKVIVQHVLPALGALYFALTSIWNLPYCEEVLGTIAAIETALGSYLGLSTAKYNKTKDGTLEIDTSNPDVDSYRLNIGVPLEELAKRNSLNLKVNPNATISQEKQTI